MAPAENRPAPNEGRRWLRLLLVVFVLAGTLRWVQARRVPAISRDGVKFVEFARDLEQRGLAALRAEQHEQHPLYSAAVLCMHETASVLGAAGTPESWQRSGQAVSLIGGVGLIAVLVWLAGLIANRVIGPKAAPAVMLATGVLAAVTPLSVRLSADVMSDTLHAAIYVAGVCCAALCARRWWASAGVGALGGLAFLTRPEGAVVVLAGLAVLAVDFARRADRLRSAGRGLLVLVCFLACAGPYWSLAGKLSPKSQKQAVEEFTGARGEPLPAYGVTSAPMAQVAAQPTVRCALERRDVPWYSAVFAAFYEVVRAGRVVIVVAGVAALYAWRRRWLEPELLAPAVCMVIHFALLTLLLARYGYLAPRHALVIVALLTPPAGAALVWLWGGLRAATPVGFSLWAGRVAVVGMLLGLGAYALRVPNAADAILADAGRSLRASDPLASKRLLLGGASERRIAFYAGMQFQPWPENEPDPERRAAALKAHLLHNRPAYYALELDSGRMSDRLEATCEAVMQDPEIATHIDVRWRHRSPGSAPDKLLRLVRFRWE